MSIHWAKESSGSLMDIHAVILLFDTSLKTSNDLTYYAKRIKKFGSLNFQFTITYDLIGFMVI